ncbi:Hypothetical_protein [Hexamita inflata]|uniref:Hypothetical_protein n=1 Tax=Hexamita inflata TaxID=28002 RepID=A0AA86QM12_9EUKA|nr:Hypothetical protein HINF_LOCUS46662 [Hexamita inflata]
MSLVLAVLQTVFFGRLKLQCKYDKSVLRATREAKRMLMIQTIPEQDFQKKPLCGRYNEYCHVFKNKLIWDQLHIQEMSMRAAFLFKLVTENKSEVRMRTCIMITLKHSNSLYQIFNLIILIFLQNSEQLRQPQTKHQTLPNKTNLLQ